MVTTISMVISIEQNLWNTKKKKKKMNTMINFDKLRRENTQEHNPRWLQIKDYPYRIILVKCFGTGRANLLLNLQDSFSTACSPKSFPRRTVFRWTVSRRTVPWADNYPNKQFREWNFPKQLFRWITFFWLI